MQQKKLEKIMTIQSCLISKVRLTARENNCNSQFNDVGQSQFSLSSKVWSNPTISNDDGDKSIDLEAPQETLQDLHGRDDAAINNPPYQVTLDDASKSDVSISNFSRQHDHCAICLAQYRDGDFVVQARNRDCHHVFHNECIVEWLVKKDECPCCRQSFLKRPVQIVTACSGILSSSQKCKEGECNQRLSCHDAMMDEAMLFGLSLMATLIAVVIVVSVCLMLAMRAKARELQARAAVAQRNADERVQKICRLLVLKVWLGAEKGGESVDLSVSLESSALEDCKDCTVLSIKADSAVSSEESQMSLCAICLGPYHDGDLIVQSCNPNCHHEFHRECIAEWLAKRDECPCCRQKFLENMVQSVEETP